MSPDGFSAPNAWAWWENRRLGYNLALAAAGWAAYALAAAIAYAFGHPMWSAWREAVALTLFLGTLFLVVMGFANVFYLLAMRAGPLGYLRAHARKRPRSPAQPAAVEPRTSATCGQRPAHLPGPRPPTDLKYRCAVRAAERLPERFNAAEWFIGRHPREGRGADVAIVTDLGALTFADLDDGVRRFAACLRKAGVHRGDRVAMILADSPSLAIAFWGTLAAGAVAVPINTLLKPHDHAVILRDCDPRVLVIDRALSDITSWDHDGGVVWTVDHVKETLSAATPEAAYRATHRDAFAFFLYSSGTTGEPKGVVHLHHDMWVCAETYGVSVLGTGPRDRAFSMAKIFFAYGLGNSLYFPLHVGASSVLFAGRPTPEAVFEQVRRHRPTLFFGVPTGYANMLAAMDAGVAADFSSVRLCVSAGESLPASLFERWRARTGLEILDGIGSTEICHIFLSNRAGACRPGSSGTPVPGYELRVVDERQEDVPRGELGDLLVRGDSTMALYWNKHETTKVALQGDWIRTGDKYRQDADGYYFHGGRSDDMIKAGGIWVSPVEVESILVAHPAVLECAVVATADADGLEKPHAFVALRPGAGSEGLEDSLKAFAKERLAAYKCPRWISFVEQLPKTATGKIQRFLLRARHEPG